MEIAVGKLTRDNFTEFSTKARIEKKIFRKFLQVSRGTFLFRVKEKCPGNEISVCENMVCRNQDFQGF